MTVPSILAKIADERRADVRRNRMRKSLDHLCAEARQKPSNHRWFARALEQPNRSVIAEIKRASPSRGDIAGITDPLELANLYRTGGASAISVLTEPRHFKGSLEDLEMVSQSIALPTLRKDFIIDPYQIWEARAAGAAAVLLIAALFEDRDELAAMIRTCDAAEVDHLVEVHDEAELDRSLEAGAFVVGVNHRNLHTFEIDLTLFSRLRPKMGDVIAVAESGIHSGEDAARMFDAGADAILVGEHLASADDPVAALRRLRGVDE